MMKGARSTNRRHRQRSIHTKLLSKPGDCQGSYFRHYSSWNQKPVLVLSAGSSAYEKARLVASFALLASEFNSFRAAAHRKGWQEAEHQAAEQWQLILRKLEVKFLLPPRGMIHDGGNLNIQRRYPVI